MAIKEDRSKVIPLTETELPEHYAKLFPEEMVIGSFRGIRDLVIFTDVRMVSIDLQGITGKKKVIATIPYHHICEMTIETAGYLDVDTELHIKTTAGTDMAFSFAKGKYVTQIQSKIAKLMV